MDTTLCTIDKHKSAAVSRSQTALPPDGYSDLYIGSNSINTVNNYGCDCWVKEVKVFDGVLLSDDDDIYAYLRHTFIPCLAFNKYFNCIFILNLDNVQSIMASIFVVGPDGGNCIFIFHTHTTPMRNRRQVGPNWNKDPNILKCDVNFESHSH